LKLLSAAGFICLAPLFALTIARIVQFESLPVVMLVQTFTPFVYLPAYPIALVAGLAKRWILLGASVALILVHLVLVFPEYRPATHLPSEAEGAPVISLFSQNVKYNGPTPERIAESIQQQDADVVFIQELTPEIVDVFEQSGALDPYEYEFVLDEWGAEGMGIWSKRPLLSTSSEPLSGFPAQRVTVDVEGTQLAMWNIHTKSPPIDPGVDGGSLTEWRQDLEEVKGLLHGEQGNVVAAGDFNSVWSHRPYREIISNGYRDEHIEHGRGYARTWAVNSEWGQRLGGYVRLDHLLTRGSARALNVDEVPGNGSDHKGLISDIAVWQ
jgi:endonuclease/exonuclease/phosphatase (EEP) superfamily protein YafD